VHKGLLFIGLGKKNLKIYLQQIYQSINQLINLAMEGDAIVGTNLIIRLCIRSNSIVRWMDPQIPGPDPTTIAIFRASTDHGT
jgi:hypothetical protein